jgi:ribosomal protein S18 acetylase RimI-like enzyme
MAYQIRTATPEDAADLATLAAAAYRDTYSAAVPTTTLDTVIAQTCTPEAFTQLINGLSKDGPDCVLVATEGARLAGFLDVREEGDELELRRLYSAVGGTGRGVGSELLAALEARLPRGTRYRIVVLAGNRRALTFWQRHGFHIISEVDGIQHFASHRSVRFDDSPRPVPLLVLDRVTGEHAE